MKHLVAHITAERFDALTARAEMYLECAIDMVADVRAYFAKQEWISTPLRGDCMT